MSIFNNFVSFFFKFWFLLFSFDLHFGASVKYPRHKTYWIQRFWNYRNNNWRDFYVRRLTVWFRKRYKSTFFTWNYMLEILTPYFKLCINNAMSFFLVTSCDSSLTKMYFRLFSKFRIKSNFTCYLIMSICHKSMFIC